MLGRSGNEARSVVPARPFAKLHTHLLSTGTSRLGHCGGSWLFTSSAVSDRTESMRLPASAWRYWPESSIGAARWWSFSRRR